ncbi:MAG: 16S rRNA (cytosine(1402)-N(4))-methyltransferase [Candidatus Levybacteria bacterium RIFCSPHIGHO2_02_FULL_39_36]|nr:MAG: Ribosomal RNA small subunit methyltransferase H [Candidatus Levybacteria bacterium GW2011_GWA1_39_11]KKR24850.1 MAG: Ribosomal RNA small subunit methyltransferase H [Candidatus Levybacteria bacterium GW2011_GWB1_39_7]KKR25858.1 MAG: Ribosomal RNA small subunit methyltransferase H [Microgenomates group bacterium GW2011_GWC1_39_7]KKR50091.1 MAG: Ribosomal RNA small subunit methyltransferase H [Candidatus Levybacteria bacterium GW2011_GWA2_40_16]OGH26022.1 MAG: 16S rRNA (cytosine(1402)-N(4
MIFHKPVLLKEAIESLKIRANGKYMDATIGGGGHARAIIEEGGIVLGIDQDPEAIEYVREKSKFKIQNSKLVLVRGNFLDIKEIAHLNNFEKPDGILFDLGISSYQLDESGRGFSFLRNEPLDMRMSKDSELTAWEIVSRWNKDELYQIFSKLGEEPNSRAISDSIVRARRLRPINTTGELADVVAESVRGKKTGRLARRHPATRIFQALRITVNRELENLEKGLKGGFEILAGGGRLSVISFHSLEDRIVKSFFRKLVFSGSAELTNKKPIVPKIQEIRENRRARSAKLRTIEKI